MGLNLSLPSSKKVKSLAKKAALMQPAVALPFAAGAAVNKLTGGKTTTYKAWEAGMGKAPAPAYSKTIQAASGYQGARPGQGKQGLPLLNRATTTGLGTVASTVIKDVVAPAADAASEGLFGVSLKTLGWVAAGSAVGLGGVYVATR